MEDEGNYLVEKLNEWMEEGDEPMHCSKCGNKTDWLVCTNEIPVTMDDEGKRVISASIKSINKPDDIVWICGKCKHVEFEGSWY